MFIGTWRGGTRILGCNGGEAAIASQNAEPITANPKEPENGFVGNRQERTIRGFILRKDIKGLC